MWKFGEPLINNEVKLPTKEQMDYIKHIWNESNHPLPPFTGKTRIEASQWITKNKHWAYQEDKE